MTEDFLMRSFELMGEKPEAIKVMRNKHTGLPAGFGFCQFRDEKQAMEILHKLNGKIIPYSQPVSISIICFYFINFVFNNLLLYFPPL